MHPKYTRPVVTSKPIASHFQILVSLITLAAVQTLTAQTSVQASLNIVSNLTSGGQDGVSLALQWSASANGGYFVQSSTNLADPSAWTTEDLVQSAPGPILGKMLLIKRGYGAAPFQGSHDADRKSVGVGGKLLLILGFPQRFCYIKVYSV